MTAKEIIQRLRAEGWELAAQRGSHAKFRRPDSPGFVTVPLHKGDLPKGTVAAIFRQAGWKK